MFVFGEATSIVENGKLLLPKQYHLKNFQIIGSWKNKKTMYLSDNINSLHYISGNSKCFRVTSDRTGYISLPRVYEGAIVEIKGCITAIELKFNKQNELIYSSENENTYPDG